MLNVFSLCPINLATSDSLRICKGALVLDEKEFTSEEKDYVSFLPKSSLGSGIEPTLFITYTQDKSVLAKNLITFITIVLPSLTIIIPSIFWLFKKTFGWKL